MYALLFIESFDPYNPPLVYIHVPFCRRRCAYCSFYSVPLGLNTADTQKAYFRKLISEVKAVRSYFKGAFPSIYIGGGTPNLPENIEYVCEVLDILGDSNEITVECNSSFLTEAALEALYKRATRFSVGVQSFSKRARNKIGRYDELDLLYGVLMKMKGARQKSKCDFPLLNLDFITNFEERETFIPLFSRFANYCANSHIDLPEHLSLYSLQVEEGTHFAGLVAAGKRNVPDQNAQATQLEREWRFLADCGYEHYEVSAFARNGNYCRHNLGYWSGKSFLGLGSEAASRIYFPSGKGMEAKCVLCAEDYAGSDAFAGYEVGELSLSDVAIEFVLTGLRTKFGVSASDIENRCGRDAVGFCRSLDGIIVEGDRIFVRSDKMIMCEYYIRRIADFLQN